MKVRPSIKVRCEHCKIVKRQGVTRTSPQEGLRRRSRRSKGTRGDDEGETVDQGAMRALQDRQAPRRDAHHLQEPPAQGAAGV